MNADGLFRGGAGEKQPDISQADLMREIGHGNEGDQKVFREILLRVDNGGLIN